MASTINADKNVVQNILRSFLKPWKSEMVTLNAVDKQIYSNPGFSPRSGNTIQVKRPHQFVTVRTATGDLSSATENDIISATATATVQDYISVYLDYGAYQEALYLDQLDQILAPIREKMIVDLEVDFNTFIKNTAAHFLGTVDTEVSKWSDIAQVNSFCKALGFPAGKLYAEVGPYAVQNLADAQKGIFSTELATSAWKEAMIPRNFGGLIAYMSNTLASHSVGDHDGGLQLNATPTQTYAGAKDTYLTTLQLKGADTGVTGFLKKGDTIRVESRYWNQMQTKSQAAGQAGAGLAYTGTVTADADSDGSGLVTVIVSGPAISDATSNNQYDTISSALAEDDTVTVLSGTASGSTVPNLFFHEQAYSLNTVKLPKLHSIDSSVASFDGMSIRAHKFSDGKANLQQIRFDILPAYACNNPLLAGKFYGAS